MYDIEHFGADFRAAFEVKRRIGSGAFGVVYEAVQKSLGRPVAIKYLIGKQREQPGARKRFEREARHLATISHPNVVRIFDYGLDGDVPYVVEELLEGEPLDLLLGRVQRLPLSRALFMGAQMSAALACVHDTGILHRDLKDANVFVLADDRIKLLDFGLAKRPGEDTDLTKSGGVVGTPAFMAPEQLRGLELTAAADLYALGVMLYLMISGQPPFELKLEIMIRDKLRGQAPSLATVTPTALPAPLVELVDSLLASDPSLRPQHAAAVKATLDTIERTVRPTKPLETAAPSSKPGPNFLSAVETVDAQQPARPPSQTDAHTPADGQSRPTAPLNSVHRRRLPWAIGTSLLLLIAIYVLVLRHAPPAVTVRDVTIAATSSSLVVSWSTDRRVATAIAHGPAQADGSPARADDLAGRLRTSTAPTTTHRIVLTGLEAATAYTVATMTHGTIGIPQLAKTLPTLDCHNLTYYARGPTTCEITAESTLPATARLEVLDGPSNALLYSAMVTEPTTSFDFLVTTLPAATSCRLRLRLHTNYCDGSEQEIEREKTFTTLSVKAKALLRLNQTPMRLQLTPPPKHRYPTTNSPANVPQLLFLASAKTTDGPVALSCYELTADKDIRQRWQVAPIDEARTIIVSQPSLGSSPAAQPSPGNCIVRTGPKTLAAYALADGKLQWQRAIPLATSDYIALFDSLVIIFEPDQGLLTFEVSSGEPGWQRPNLVLRAPWYLDPSPRVWAASEFYDLWAYEATTGVPIHNLRIQLPHQASCHPIAAADLLYVGTVSGKLLAARPADKKVRRIFDEKPPVSDLACDDTFVYCLSGATSRAAFPLASVALAETGSVSLGETSSVTPVGPPQLSARAHATFNRRWHHELPTGCSSPLAIRAGRLYYVDDDGVIYCHSGATGRLLWRHRPAGGRPIAGPLALHFTATGLVAVTADGTVLHLRDC